MDEEQVAGRRMGRILGHVSGDASASRPSTPRLLPTRHGNQLSVQPLGSRECFMQPLSAGKEEISKEHPHNHLVARSSQGIRWLPKMDIAESATHFFVLIELPGVSIGDMRVEVDNQNLTVIGQRFTEPWKLINGSENLNFIYHQREILNGSYQVTWPLPKNVNKDMVSAEFVDGFLQISLPKI